MTTRVPSYTVAELEEETGFDRRTIAYYVQEELLPRVGRRGPRTRYPKLVRDRLLFIRRVREAEEGGRVPAVSLDALRKIFERVSPALIAGVADGRLAVTEELVLPASTAFRLPEMRRAALRERVARRGMARENPRWYGREVDEELPELPRAPAPEDYPVVASPARSPEAEPDDCFDEDASAALHGMPEEPATVAEAGLILADEARMEAAKGVREHYDVQLESAGSPEIAARLAELLSRLQEAAKHGCDDAPRSMDTWTRIDISPEIVLSVRNISEEDRELVQRVRRAMREVIL